ncbi:hypothetical protein BN134_4039 [Cronobacter dublinensis 1210]|uniref:Uncharacterized protein n=1 Tax=Cronobacter dublinensis 1210 TaxID=1208656 RepID=A0ABP1WE26_9ENTR|nr:hypothetical protein BN134_4039 [Cronobacter dublinensis 1210]
MSHLRRSAFASTLALTLPAGISATQAARSGGFFIFRPLG